MRPLLDGGATLFLIKEGDQFLGIDRHCQPHRASKMHEASCWIERKEPDKICLGFNQVDRNLRPDPRPRPPRFEVIEINRSEVEL